MVSVARFESARSGVDATFVTASRYLVVTTDLVDTLAGRMPASFVVECWFDADGRLAWEDVYHDATGHAAALEWALRYAEANGVPVVYSNDETARTDAAANRA